MPHIKRQRESLSERPIRQPLSQCRTGKQHEQNNRTIIILFYLHKLKGN